MLGQIEKEIGDGYCSSWTEIVRLGYLGLYVVHSVSCG